jgi:hypothetical protein
MQVCNCNGLISFQPGTDFLADEESIRTDTELTLSFWILIPADTSIDNEGTPYFLLTGEMNDPGWFGIYAQEYEGDYELKINILGKEVLPLESDAVLQIESDAWTLVTLSFLFAEGNSGQMEVVSQTTIFGDETFITFGTSDGSDGTLDADSFSSDIWAEHGFLEMCGAVPLVTSSDLGSESIQPTDNYQDGISLSDIILWDRIVDTETLFENARQFN